MPGSAVQTAVAEESGTFSAIGSYARDYVTFDHSIGTITGGSLKGTSIILQSSGGSICRKGARLHDSAWSLQWGRMRARLL